MHEFELLTNFDSPTTRALQIAAGRLGGRVTPLDDLEGPQDLAAREPVGALVFVYGWPAHALRQLEGLRAAGVPTAVWQVDDPSHFRNPGIHDVVVACARACDVFFSHTLELTDEYAARGVTVEYLPTGARDLPGLAALVGPLPAEEALELDYVFVASPSPARREAFARVERLLPGLRGEFVSGVTQLEAMRRSRYARVTLFFGANSAPDGPPEGWGLSERSWEVPLVGGLLVQEDRIHLRDHFEPGVDAVAFSTIAECADHVATLVGDPERRRELALRAREKVLSSHRLCDRLHRVVDRLAAVRTAGRVA